MKKVLRILFILFLLLIVVNVSISMWLSQQSGKYIYHDLRQLPHNSCALVLGTAKYDDKGGQYQSYWYRIYTAANLYKAGKVKYLLVSSDNSKKYSYNAATMKADLVSKDIPPANILVDTMGRRTIESVLRCKNIFGFDTVTIVSQERHCERALYIAQHFGLYAIAYAAPAGDIATTIGSIWHEQAARLLMLYELFIKKED